MKRGARRCRRVEDARLAALIRDGDEAAFEALYDRHHASLLAFCRHMLGNREDAEDALQQTFLRAHGALRQGRLPDSMRPWLYAIARNRCRTVLAARRDTTSPADDFEPGFDGLAEDVRRRADLRELVHDLGRLPEDQRGALVLFELGDMSHAEIASVIGCAPGKVKALVFQARQSLIAERDARATPCEEIRSQLEVARAGVLRRGSLRRHLRQCAPCDAYRLAVAQQRSGLALVMPVVPTAGLKAAVLTGAGASGAGGAAAAAGTASAGAAAATGGGAAATAGGLAVKALVAKVAVTAAVAGAGVSGGVVAIGDDGDGPRPTATESGSALSSTLSTEPGAGSPGRAQPGGSRGAAPSTVSAEGPQAQRLLETRGTGSRRRVVAPRFLPRGRRAAARRAALRLFRRTTGRPTRRFRRFARRGRLGPAGIRRRLRRRRQIISVAPESTGTPVDTRRRARRGSGVVAGPVPGPGLGIGPRARRGRRRTDFVPAETPTATPEAPEESASAPETTQDGVTPAPAPPSETEPAPGEATLQPEP